MSRRRRELLSIAAELFAEHGFANVTVDEIGLAAGISGPALYHHFASKEALLGEMLVGISEYLLESGRTAAVRGGPVIARLIDLHVQFAVRDRALIAVQFRDLVHATAADQAKVRALQSRYLALWVDELTRACPELERRTARGAVQATFGLINSTAHARVISDAAGSETLATMAQAALEAICPVVGRQGNVNSVA